MPFLCDLDLVFAADALCAEVFRQHDDKFQQMWATQRSKFGAVVGLYGGRPTPQPPFRTL